MRYMLRFSYDGSTFFGYQCQPKTRTVQDEIERVIKQIHPMQDIHLVASGRTDAGVHALNQIAHIDLDTKLSPDQLKKAINSLLLNDIYIKEVKEVSSDFHARFSAKSKIYQYQINMGEYNPLEWRYVYQYNHMLDKEAMRKASMYLVGKHNFKSFTKIDVQREDYVREIYQIDIKQAEDKLILTFVGNGFLRYMVRNLVGTLIEVGQGKRDPEEVKKLLDLQDRAMAGKTAPSEGLCLKGVVYNKTIEKTGEK